MPFILRNSFVYVVRRGNLWLGFRAFIYDRMNIRPHRIAKQSRAYQDWYTVHEQLPGSRVTPSQIRSVPEQSWRQRSSPLTFIVHVVLHQME